MQEMWEPFDRSRWLNDPYSEYWSEPNIQIPDIRDNTLIDFIRNWCPGLWKDNNFTREQQLAEDARFARAHIMEGRYCGKTSYALLKCLFVCLKLPQITCEYRTTNRKDLEYTSHYLCSVILYSKLCHDEYITIDSNAIYPSIFKNSRIENNNNTVYCYHFYNNSSIMFLDEREIVYYPRYKLDKPRFYWEDGDPIPDRLQSSYVTPIMKIEDYGAALSITGSDIVISNIEKPVVICREVTTGSDYDIIITEKG